MLLLLVESHPIQTHEVLIQEDNSGVRYDIISDDPHLFPLMETAMASGRYVSIGAYPDHNPPENPYGTSFARHQACFAIPG